MSALSDINAQFAIIRNTKTTLYLHKYLRSIYLMNHSIDLQNRNQYMSTDMHYIFDGIFVKQLTIHGPAQIINISPQSISSLIL